MTLNTRLITILFFSFISSTVFANDPPPTAPRLQSQSQPNINNMNRDMRQLKYEMQNLQKQVNGLRQQINAAHGDSHSVRRPARVTQWSCYLNTHSDGSFHATGHTRNEALGRTLGNCNNKVHSNVICVDHKVVCSTE